MMKPIRIETLMAQANAATLGGIGAGPHNLPPNLPAPAPPPNPLSPDSPLAIARAISEKLAQITSDASVNPPPCANAVGMPAMMELIGRLDIIDRKLKAILDERDAARRKAEKPAAEPKPRAYVAGDRWRASV